MRPRQDYKSLGLEFLRSILPGLPPESGPPYAVPLEDALRIALVEHGLQLVSLERGPNKNDVTALLCYGGNRYGTCSVSTPWRDDFVPNELDDELYDAMLKKIDVKIKARS